MAKVFDAGTLFSAIEIKHRQITWRKWVNFLSHSWYGVVCHLKDLSNQCICVHWNPG